MSSGHGLIYRFASSILGWHPEYLDLRSTAHTVSAWDLLDQATRLSRWLSFVVFAVFVMTFYGLVLWITRETTVTFLVTFFVATSQVALWHSRAIRPEIPSLLFSILALWVVAASARPPARGENRRPNLAAFALGLLLALAIFSKIQILPVVACLLILGLGRAWVIEGNATKHDIDHRLRVCLALGVLLAIVVPWWALGKPEFLTDPYLASVGYFDRLVYGSMTASFVPLVAAAIGLSLTGTVVGMGLNRKPDGSRSAGRLARLLTFLHLMSSGQ